MEKKEYEVYRYGDKLSPGKELTIQHSLSYRETDLAALVALPLKDVDARRKASAEKETAIHKKLISATGEWEQQAWQTMQLDKALEYLRTRPVAHTANQWKSLDKDSKEISNMVYKMWYRIYERTAFSHSQNKSIPVAWEITWSLCLNKPDKPGDYYNSTITLAGQDKKVYKDKDAMQRYLDGRIKEYSGLFTEISPPIPSQHVWQFKVNGQLLPGYTTQEDYEKELLDLLTDDDFSSEKQPAELERKAEPTKAAPVVKTAEPKPAPAVKSNGKTSKPRKKSHDLTR